MFGAAVLTHWTSVADTMAGGETDGQTAIPTMAKAALPYSVVRQKRVVSLVRRRGRGYIYDLRRVLSFRVLLPQLILIFRRIRLKFFGCGVRQLIFG